MNARLIQLLLPAFLLAAQAVCAENAAPSTTEAATETKLEAKESTTVRTQESTTVSSRKPGITLALGGGGARCAAHIGVLRVLEREHIPIRFIAGTSMGALVGGLYGGGVSIDEIEKAFLNTSEVFKVFVPTPSPTKFGGLLPLQFAGLLGYKPPVGLYKGSDMRKYIHQALPQDKQLIEQANFGLAVVTTNLNDGTTFSITSGDMATAIQASCTLPGVFRPVKYGEMQLADGGLTVNVPVSVAKELTNGPVVSVNVDEVLDTIDVQPLTTLTGMSNRVVNVVLAKMDRDQVAQAAVAITPAIGKISLYSHSPKDARAAIKAGEEAAERALPKLRELLAQ